MTDSKYNLYYDNETSAHLTTFSLSQESSEFSLPVIAGESTESIEGFKAELLLKVPWRVKPSKSLKRNDRKPGDATNPM